MEATYTDAYYTCTTAPFTIAKVLVPGGKCLPGVPKNDVYGVLRFGDELGPFATASAQYVSHCGERRAQPSRLASGRKASSAVTLKASLVQPPEMVGGRL